MFKELGPLLRQRTVVMILTRLDDETIRVNIIPRKLNDSENEALTIPLSATGAAEELDSQLPSALVQFVGAHLELRNTLDSAKQQMAVAAKAAKAEVRSKTTASARKETAKPGFDVAGIAKTAEVAGPEPQKTASLFDAPTPTHPVQSKVQAAGDETREVLAEAAEEQESEPSEDMDEAA